MKKFLSFFFLCCVATVGAAPTSTLVSSSFEWTAPSLAPIAQKLFTLPEARQLLAEIQGEGPVYLEYLPLGANNSNAHWEFKRRCIAINSSKQRTEGRILCSILFEMHNAKSTRDFSYYDALAKARRISKYDYVEAVEYIEHQNALKTCALVEKGIRQGLFPMDARWPITPDFAEHFRIQQSAGHSSYIASVYEALSNQQFG